MANTTEPDAMRTDIIKQTRKELERRRVFAVVVFTGDPHISEYVAERWKIRDVLSGFRGSAGRLAVTRQGSALWTDSRYFLEAEQALAGSGIMLMREAVPETPELAQWLASEFGAWSGGADAGRNALSEQVLVDAEATSVQACSDLSSRLEGLRLEPVRGFFDALWQNRPAIPSERIYEISTDYTGENRETRLARLRRVLADTQFILISALDEIAWLLNLRGADVEYNPVFYAYLLLSAERCILCTHFEDMSPALQNSLKDIGIELAPYADITKVVQNIAQQNGEAGSGRIFADPASINIGLWNAMGDSVRAITSPIKLWKAIKTEAEIRSTREVMEIDGVAMVKALHWIQAGVQSNAQTELSELSISQGLKRFRAEGEGFIGSSFASIVGFRENGAVIHYSVSAESSKPVSGKGLLLIDSGGQYTNGTTDITRTVPVGQVGEQMRRQFTVVLKGHIALAQAVFPKGTSGLQLDSIARQALWQAGMNYGHGTGHGVGFALNVHEGPQNIAPSAASPRNVVPLEVGMICSNEPGYYVDSSHGIRIENLVLVVPHPEYESFLCFETLSLAPIELDLVVSDMLSPVEIAWINDYHSTVRERIASRIDIASRRGQEHQNKTLLKWLAHKTRRL